jgi:hypothetical protein
MSKSVRPSVSFTALVAAIKECRDHGVELAVDEKASWLKISAPNGNRVYIARQDRVKQVDLSGFGSGWEGTTQLERLNGSVQAHLDLTDEAAAVSALKTILSTMGDVPNESKRSGGKAARPSIVGLL